jgi:GNAT superfamily N-acetyltransferase
MWKRKGTRTTPDAVRRLLKEKRLILAENGGVVVGSVNVNLMSGRIGEFGMLVSDVNHRGKGVGSALIKAAEQWAKRMGESALVTCLMIVTRFFGNVFHGSRLPGLLLAARNSRPLYNSD